MTFALPRPGGAAEPEGSGLAPPTDPEHRAWPVRAAAFFEQLPPPTAHYVDLSDREIDALLARDAHHAEVRREQSEGRWFAALVDTSADATVPIVGHFATWHGLVEFLTQHDALVEVWSCGEGIQGAARRIPAPELARLKRQRHEPPTLTTVTYADPQTGTIVSYRLEFGFEAAASVLAAQQAYQRHRLFQLTAHEILRARNADGLPDAVAQWEALQAAVREQRLAIGELPPRPLNPRDLYVAFVFAVDEQNNFQTVLSVFRDSELRRRIVGDTQALILQRYGEVEGREVLAFGRRGISDELEPVPNPLPGQDIVELRVRDPGQADPRRWPVLEFGEPEVLKQSALAHFSLLNAYLQKHRKKVALKQADLGLIVEPIIAGLNIGGGVTGVPFPLGAAGRLAYNALIMPRLIPDVPSVKEMRELLQLLAARDQHPELKAKPAHFLNADDLQTLRQASRKLSDADVADYLQRLGDEDVKAMLRLAQMQRIDAQVVNLLSIVTEAGKVSGWTDQEGAARDVFNNIYFSMTGELSIYYTVAVLAGAKQITPLSGVPLYDLARGNGPAEAWLQYLNLTVDIRAVANTLTRLSYRQLANKELKRPFPYAPLLSDLAAYEFRIFGFPLLMFYKHGLVRADLEAYQHDYAYGLLGVKIVEHFRTREEMEAEIRAGRVVPLGYVRVPAGKGVWKETNLAVFAHRIPGGKHRGKTALILYGLKAYEEHSALIERERRRFQEFERGLQEGAVIEQFVAGEPTPGWPAPTWEPVIHVGARAAEEWYEPLLGDLLELRSDWQRQSWGLPPRESDRAEARAIRERLAARGLHLPEGNPLEGIDKFGSRFRYRRHVEGQWRTVEVTRIPSLAEVDRALEKAEEAKQIEELRRATAAGASAGLILLNQVVTIHGRREVGPLLQNREGRVIGAGVTSGAQALSGIFDMIDRLPVVDRARLRFNRFAATVVELDTDGDGVREPVFLTIEFPAGEVRREWTNPLSGEPETLVFLDGQWRQAITDRRILELDYDARRIEIRSRTYENRGHRRAPVRGELLEETRLLDCWFRDLNQPGLDPNLPMISKLRVNYVTGEFARDTYGLFPLPVEVADDQYVTQNRYTAYGLLESAQVYENGQDDADFGRPALERVVQPRRGRERFRLRSTLPELVARPDASAQGYQTSVQRTDLITHVSKTEIFDQTRGGRKTSESYVDTVHETQSLSATVRLEYDDSFHHGLIPVRAFTRSTPGTQLATTSTVAYDPAQRRLTAVEVDYTGRSVTNTWDYRWANPVVSETPQRRTVNEYNRQGTTVRGVTTLSGSEEVISTFTGRYDPDDKTFRVARLVWHRPGRISRVETNTYSAFGKLITTQLGEIFLVRPDYRADGTEQGRRTLRRDPATGQFTIPHREEDDYRWQNGERDARVRTWIEGAPHDEYRVVVDAEGRTKIDGIRLWPQLRLETVLTYEGTSERLLRAEMRQNGDVRATHRGLAEVPQADGRYWVRVEVTPAWGLVHTNSYLLGDPLGRPVAIEYENGDRVRGVEWFADAAMARVSELIDRHGRARERQVRRLNVGAADGLPYDQVVRSRLSPWGEAGFAEAKALVRGTDIPLFQETPEARIYYDLNRVIESPRWAVDPHGRLGLPVRVAGTNRSQVIAVFRSQFRERRGLGGTNSPPERVLEQERIDLLGLFYHQWTRRISDRLAAVLEEQTGKIENLGPRAYSEEALLEALAQAPPLRKFTYRYDPGWLWEPAQAQGAPRQMVFTQTRPPAEARAWSVNEAGWREGPTEVEGQQAATEGQLSAAGATPRLFRRLQQPRLLRHNPHLPEVTNVWTVWTSRELNEQGETLFEADVFLNALGEVSTTVARKINSRGQPATKVAYRLPWPDSGTWRVVAGPRRAEALGVTLAGPTDLSACDFIGFYVDAPARPRVRLQLRDATGREVIVARDPPTEPRGPVGFWPVDRAQVQWLPGEFVPERGAVVVAPAAALSAGNAFVVSVPELVRAGLDVRRLTTVDLGIEVGDADLVRVSSLDRMESGGIALLPQRVGGFAHDGLVHASGIEASTRAKLRRSHEEVRTQRGWQAQLRYNGLAVANITPRQRPPYYPVVSLVDHADPDSPRPLYALAADDGRFLEYYQTIRAGDPQVYTVASGFETPKLEVVRAAVLDDELSPGVLAFGRGYDITIPLARGGGWLSTTLADLRNRCVASSFTLAGDRVLQLLPQLEPRRTEFRRLTRELGSAELQAAAINDLPMLARALLPRQEVPWAKTAAAPTAPLGAAIRTNALGVRLRQLSQAYLRTGLIPTSPGTGAARFVDTVQEGALIELAIKLGEVKLAGELLAFYQAASQGGTIQLLASYDAQTGASLVKEPRYKRPSDAPATAAAQLAIAEAAFCFGAATGDTNAFELGQNLVSLILRSNVPAMGELASPRGIAESSARGPTVRRGITLWPEARAFSLKSNARAYLLFSRLEELADRHPFDAEWRQLVGNAAREQAGWLIQRILPHVQRTGVVPRGLFEIQDVITKTRALAVERWTAADDWLTFLEAADRLRISREVTRSWLDNLARVHGVTVGGIWGLDWSVALGRPDAISPELTAKFVRIANQLDHRAAADFAQRNLNQLRDGEQWPAVVTSASTNALLPTGQGFAVYPIDRSSADGRSSRMQGGWPETLGVDAQQMAPEWPATQFPGDVLSSVTAEERDITEFLWTAAGFYLAIVATALFWWSLSAARRRRRLQTAPLGALVSDAVMRKAEERWAKRVLGLQLPPTAERSRYSNSAVEQNFHMQLRAAYKLVLEWRRLVNGWAEDDPRLVEDGSDPWLNGMDEFVVMVGLFSRWVVKAGRKDGRRQADVLTENEDSNHIWSRLVMYISESHLGLLGLLKEYKARPEAAAFLGTNDQIELVLRTLGARARPEPFDARTAFDVPGRPEAFDLLHLQLPGARLPQIAEEMERKLGIPCEHLVNFVKNFRSFKEREQLFPIHPYLLEAAKVLPHFVLMGLVSLISYNDELGGLRIYPHLKELAVRLALDPQSLIWAAPLFAGFALSVTAYLLEVYRHRWRARSPAEARMALDATLTSLFVRETQAATPAIRTGRWWNPVRYRQAGWILRAVGLVLLVGSLLASELPSFASFMFVKGLVVVVLLVEAAGILVPLAVSRFSSWLEDYTTASPSAGALARFINQLNLVPTRPASLLWLSIRYHFQPSVPTGGWGPMLQAIVFYLVFGAAFFVVGSYMYKQALEVWFQETYRSGRDVGLVVGGFLFWNTMYLLRFGLFVLLASVASAFATYPFRVLGALVALSAFALRWLDRPLGHDVGAYPALSGAGLAVGLALMIFEPEVLAWLRASRWFRRRAAQREARERQALAQLRRDPERALGVVYMSGDDLAFQKLTPELLLARLRILRDQLDSGGLRLLSRLQPWPDDTALTQWFRRLYELEKKHDVTLWHPSQLVPSGATPRWRPELGLNLLLDDADECEPLLAAWHVRRWLVTMMSTAGHAQDTGINLVDIALRLAEEGLGPNTVFYLIQNKYDNGDRNRPSQLPYDQGELGQRNKLARLLMEAAPGARAYSINDWTPFGFKAGGLVGMDLVYEEALRLTNMLVLDRNANAHDLDAVVADVKLALSDPGIVIVIPGRSTTNTLTPLGQSSQLVEEGQRALTRGVMLLGGTAAETLGTGWGNLQAVYYGRVQRALCDPSTAMVPLTTPGRRGVPFGDRFEGLIGFGPHAVGISEDIWGVTQAAHNALALGYQVRFHRSQALWHKMRESWSHAEWFSAFPRWSGGYLQMMLDPLMQRINDEGPLSVFAKEIRANGGRFFLSAPSALLSILLMPLAILFDVSPFVQILILLWNLGFVMNQVLTALGLVACLESTGFNRVTSLIGTALAGLLAGTIEGWSPFAAPLLAGGCLAGGFAVGLGRWLYYRGRDVMLFGPQLVIHALGQAVRQSLEFVLSGASANDAKAVNVAFRASVGPREDRPTEGYQNLVNLRTVVWGVGLVSLCLNLFALTQLDFLNALLLLPSLMFSVSTLVGPFVMHPKAGRHLGRWVWAPKLLGWLASFTFYSVVAWLVARGAGWAWLGGGLAVACFGRVTFAGLKYFGYARRLRRTVQQFTACLTGAGLEPARAGALANQIVLTLGGDAEKIRSALQKAGLVPEQQAAVEAWARDRVVTLLRQPMEDLRQGRFADSRFICEFERSFVLGLFTFLWFFIVPVPGLLVFTVPFGYRVTVPLASLLTFAGGVWAAVMVGWLASLWLEWLDARGLAGRGLIPRLETEYRRFQSLVGSPRGLTPLQTASLYALFTDAQTYVDQRGFEYARRTLKRIRQTLDAASPGA